MKQKDLKLWHQELKQERKHTTTPNKRLPALSQPPLFDRWLQLLL
jgi:hypothetical protein